MKIFPNEEIAWPVWYRPFMGFTVLYHLGWGIFFLIKPNILPAWMHLEIPGIEAGVRGLGIFILLLSLGYGLAGKMPLQYWGFILLGFCLKAGAGVVTFVAIGTGYLPQDFWFFPLLNDLMWLLPFGLALHAIYKRHPAHQVDWQDAAIEVPAAVSAFSDQHGRNLKTLQEEQRVLLVFLRHFGCTFCRETMADLARDWGDLKAKGIMPVVVHQSLPERADEFFAHFGLEDMARISDPERRLYQTFDLGRGNVAQMFGWKSWLRGVRAGVWDGHWVGREEGDGWQMPGVFLLFEGWIEQVFLHQTAADRPDYQLLACKFSNGLPQDVSSPL